MSRIRIVAPILAVIFALVLILGFFARISTVYADHSWGGYHFARTANPFTLKIGDNLTGAWDPYLATTVSDWSASSVLDMTIVPGNTLKNIKRCNPTNGRVEVCNSKYGANGWLGIASVWTSGTHITQGTVKMNDTYFSTAQYNTSAWKNLVLCQEVGHTLGLDHQDENFTNANFNTCMDYTNNPEANQHPNQHDYDMLETLYAHLDTTNTVSQTLPASAANVDLEDPKNWGEEVRRSKDGRASLFARDFGKGHKAFTFVFWAEPKGQNHDH